MRKSHLLSLNAALKTASDELRKERDGLLADLHREVGSLRADVAGLKDKAEAHGRALAKHGDDLSGLAGAVRASLLGNAGDKAEAKPETVTPIKRGSKAAG